MTIGTRMIDDGRTAHQIFDDIMANPARPRFGFGSKVAVVNVDFQNAYTRIDEFDTAYEADPRQIEHTNRISALARDAGMPVVWTRVAYADDASDCGVWGTRPGMTEALAGIKYGSRRHGYDERCDIRAGDVQFTKRMPSAFFETPLASLLVWHRVDTVIVTGGSTSGCVRATAVEALSHGYRPVVPIETCADKLAAYHYANLCDLALKYADVCPVAEVEAWFRSR